ncbi:MAG: electron transfer flavoprotein subunit alpha [Elusimicrobia bacterium RIFOXYB2_FULL_49_7]|nr:MAG: electron transfer flavoprotein subunit alpha [Elusimicrobia bacterium RIFOXYB2_FULL_49_7]
MESKNDVLIYIETEHNEVAPVSIELVSKARDIADQLGVKVCAVAIGKAQAKYAPALFAYGCDIFYTVEDSRLSFYETLPFAKALVKVIKTTKPQIVLFGATSIGRDLAPRVASELKVGLTADCTDLAIGNHEDPKTKKVYEKILYQIRPAFGGNIVATIVSPEHRPQMATVREGVMKLAAPDKKRKGKVVKFKVDFSSKDFIVKMIKRVVGSRKVNLTGANIIVSGGAGVGSRENFKLIFELAKTIGGTVGASRAAVDSGLIEHDHQVGQTGTTVRPKLYIACGISGAIQHRAGMEHSSKIIAINSDPDAPMLKIAHYAIVGDLKEVIPMMIKAYKSKG